MNCHETIRLCDAYLDKEMDAVFSHEIRRHLDACPECRRHFNEQQQFQAGLAAALCRGGSSQELWREEETAIKAAFEVNPPVTSAPQGWAWLWPHPGFYAAIAAVWALLFCVNRMLDGDVSPRVRAVESSPGLQAALKEQRRQFDELLMATELNSPPSMSWMAPRSELHPAWEHVMIVPIQSRNRIVPTLA